MTPRGSGSSRSDFDRQCAPRWDRSLTREHRDKVKSYVDLGLKEGASLVVDGRALQGGGAAGWIFSSEEACSTR